MFALLVLAGVMTGAVGYLTGLASLVSYPALLAAGLSPVAANATNTLALVGVGIGSTVRASAVAFDDSPLRTVPQLAIGLVGGGIGGWLLLLGGDSVFEAVVPWLVLVGSFLLLLSPWLNRRRGGQQERWDSYLVVLFFVAIYCGYFGAGAGVILMATMALLTTIPFGRSVVLKSLVLAMANILASVLFIASGVVDWAAAIALGLGCIAGGSLGPVIQRMIPERVLRPVVAIAGFGLAAWLWVR